LESKSFAIEYLEISQTKRVHYCRANRIFANPPSREEERKEEKGRKAAAGEAKPKGKARSPAEAGIKDDIMTFNRRDQAFLSHGQGATLHSAARAVLRIVRPSIKMSRRAGSPEGAFASAQLKHASAFADEA